MKIRNIFKSKISKIIILTVVTVFLIAVTARGRSGPMQGPLGYILKPFYYIGDGMAGFFGNFGNIFTQNKKLIEENEKLRSEKTELYAKIAENVEFEAMKEDLESSLGIKERFTEFDWIHCDIIARDAGNWTGVFTLNRGSRSGIGKNDVVVYGKGLVGRVIWVGNTTCKVLPIINMDSQVSAMISDYGSLVEVSGDMKLKDEGRCILNYIDKDVNISPNMYVQTSGIDGSVFPLGLIIGKVVSVENINEEPGRYAVIEPVVDFKKLRTVFVLIPKEE